MKKKKSKKIFKFILTIVIVFVIFISLFYFINDRNNNVLFRTLKDVSNFTMKLVNYPYNKVKSKEEIKSLNLVEAENHNLRKEIEQYKKELELKESLTDKKIVSASIIKRSTTYWYNTITINKGTKDGIENGNAVINSDGVIGKVIKANANSSDVKLLTSKKSNDYVSAMFTYEDNVYYGLIDNYNVKTNELHLKNVIGDFKDNIVGLNVVTSGLSDSFSSGLLIGKITKLDKDNYGISNDIYISPSSNFNDITIVSVIVR